jgi:hypothetical protein
VSTKLNLDASNRLQASRISKSWLARGHVGNQRSRGINRPAFYCYMNSAVQALMHQPIFLNWIQSHNHRRRRGRSYQTCNPCNLTPPPYAYMGRQAPPIACAACVLKDLTNAYWANTPTNVPLPFPNRYNGNDAMTRIENIAIASTFFQRGEQDCARALWDFLLERASLSCL